MNELAVFVGGIHGTGKSVFASACSKDLGLDHISASNIIYQQNVLDKNVADIDKNQDVLVTGFYSLPSSRYIMDGHYALLDKNSSISRIPINTFTLLKPKRLVLLTSRIEQIYTRLLKRDGKQYSLDLLSAMQHEEKKYYLELCEHLSVKEEIIPNDF